MPADTSPKGHFRSLQVVFMSLVFLPSFFGLFVLYLTITRVDKSFGQDAIMLTLLPPVFLFLGILLGNFLYRQLIKSTSHNHLSLVEKIMYYKTAILVRGALFEVAAILACIACLVTGKLTVLGTIPLTWVFFFLYRPTRAALKEDLKLNHEEDNQMKF